MKIVVSLILIAACGPVYAGSLANEFARKGAFLDREFCQNVIRAKQASLQDFAQRAGSTIVKGPEAVKGDGGTMEDCSTTLRVYIKLADGRVCITRIGATFRGEMETAYGSCQ